jgi:hypothetical protein
MFLRGAGGVFITAFLLCLLTAGGHLYSPDEEIMFRATESIATAGRLDVEPIVGPDGATFATRRGVNGLEYPQYGVGNSLAGVPLYWAGALVCKMVPAATAERFLDFETQLYAPDGPARGHGLLKRFAVSFTGSIIASLTAMLIYLFCRKLSKTNLDIYSNAACWMTALAYIAGTLALPHARTFFSEPLATLFVLWAFYLLSGRVMDPVTPLRAMAAGGALALALFTRLDSLFAASGVGLYALWRLEEPQYAEAAWGVVPLGLKDWVKVRLKWRSVGVIAAFSAPLVVFFAWQLLMNALHFGSAFSSAYADQPEGINFSTPMLAGLYGFLFSIGKSLILFSPALLLAMFGISRFCWSHQALAVCLLVSAGSILLVHSSWQNWAGGWCWGPRHIFMVHALLILPAVAFLGQRGAARRITAEAILLVAFCVQMYGSSQSFIDFYVLYYRTPYTAPNARVMYGSEDLAPSFIQATAVGPEGDTVPYPMLALPAPINDSIYVPQNSQWYRYGEMWNSGYTDNLWLRLLQRSRAKEQPIL